MRSCWNCKLQPSTQLTGRYRRGTCGLCCLVDCLLSQVTILIHSATAWMLAIFYQPWILFGGFLCREQNSTKRSYENVISSCQSCYVILFFTFNNYPGCLLSDNQLMIKIAYMCVCLCVLVNSWNNLLIDASLLYCSFSCSDWCCRSSCWCWSWSERSHSGWSSRRHVELFCEWTSLMTTYFHVCHLHT